MSKEILEKVLKELKGLNYPHLGLIRSGDGVLCRTIHIEPPEELKQILADISKNTRDKLKSKQDAVKKYDGTTDNSVIYKIETGDWLIQEWYNSLLAALDQPKHEGELDDISDCTAYVLWGAVSVDGEAKTVKLFSVKNPITTLTHKFLYEEGTLKPINKKVLSLKTTVEVVIVDNTVYLLSLEGERLFPIERAYKNSCEAKIQQICDAEIVSDATKFSEAASRGHNPRRLAAFSEENLNILRDVNNRKTIANTFSINLNARSKFDMDQDDTAEKLIKFLCKRAAILPITNIPVETAAQTLWSRKGSVALKEGGK